MLFKAFREVMKIGLMGMAIYSAYHHKYDEATYMLSLTILLEVQDGLKKREGE